MRQLRVKSDSCHGQTIVTKCKDDYSFINEEKSSFQPGWSNETTQLSNSSINRAFQYQTGDELSTYVYAGEYATYNSGGYAYEFRGRLSDLRSNISELHQLGWIDEQTRAVIIQFSLYNPNVELFTSATLLVEFLSVGSLYPQSRFEPLSFQCKSFVVIF
jgi:polycystin 1L2